MQFTAIDIFGKVLSENKGCLSISYMSVNEFLLFNQILLLSIECNRDWRDGVNLLRVASEMGFVAEVLSISSNFRSLYSARSLTDETSSLVGQSLGTLMDEETFESVLQAIFSQHGNVDYLSQHCSFNVSPDILMIDLTSSCNEHLSRSLVNVYFRFQVYQYEENQIANSIAWGLFFLSQESRNNASRIRNSMAMVSLLQADKSRMLYKILKLCDDSGSGKDYGFSKFVIDKNLKVGGERVKEIEMLLRIQYQGILLAELSTVSNM
jgi:hypothetical protein